MARVALESAFIAHTLRADHGHSVQPNPEAVHPVGANVEQGGIRGVMPVAGKKCPLLIAVPRKKSASVHRVGSLLKSKGMWLALAGE